MSPSDHSLLADLRAVMAEATPGGWCNDADRGEIADGLGFVIARVPDDGVRAAIVALRNAWPALEAALAQAEADRAELERLREQLAAATEAAAVRGVAMLEAHAALAERDACVACNEWAPHGHTYSGTCRIRRAALAEESR